MEIPGEFEAFINTALVAIKYEGASPDDCFQVAQNALPPDGKQIVSVFLNEVVAGNVDEAVLNSRIAEWAHRYGLSIEGDLVRWIASAKATVG